jgi:hypothetical protein
MFYFILVFLSIVTLPLYAYIDPGTGSYIVQMLIAGFVAMGFLAKIFWKRIIAFFLNLFGKKVKDEGEE